MKTIPIWEQPVQSPVTQTLFEPGTISLAAGATYLDSISPPTNNDAHVAVLPDGNYKRQIERIYVPKTRETDTARWRVTGTFVKFVSLLFTDIGHSAVLEWDGDGWHLIGGNALPEI